MTAGLCNSNEQGAGHGTITAQVNGVLGGSATAISIAQFASLPSLVNLGTISASATTTKPTTILGIAAYGIFDASGTLSSITNIGAIEATDHDVAEQRPDAYRARSGRKHDAHQS